MTYATEYSLVGVHKAFKSSTAVALSTEKRPIIGGGHSFTFHASNSIEMPDFDTIIGRSASSFSGNNVFSLLNSASQGFLFVFFK